MPKMPKLLRNQLVSDAEENLILRITNADVRDADARDPTKCAAARALRRQYKVTEVCVMRSVTYVNFGSKTSPTWTRYLTPESLSREIVAIDRGGRFEPGEYRISRPHKTKRLGAYKGSGKKAKGRKNAPERGHYHTTANIREV